jgi:TctA family transporter
MVKAGVFLLARLHPALGGTPEWAWIVTTAGAATMLTGALLAVGQRDLKRLLAYHSIENVGIIVMGAGLVGYFMRYFGFPVLPAVLGVVLGGLIEANYRRSLLLSGGDYAIFLEDPIAIAFFAVAIAVTAGSLVGEWRRANRKRKEKAL